MSQKLVCSFPIISGSYDIEIGNGQLKVVRELTDYLKTLGSKFAIITQETLVSPYGKPLQKAFSDNGLEAYLLSFPDGEKYKTRATKEGLEDKLFQNNFGRDSCLIALGGGVVTDLVGFLAATYCRGIHYISIPTSLLAMVDASIGGKTAVNVLWGKNLLGAFHQPRKVIIDADVLHTLPKEEFRNGIVEMVKHAIINDAAYFAFLEKHVNDLQELNEECLQTAIYESCRIKSEIIAEDEREAGQRALLNFGHTVGHALELLSQYSLSHGEAVAIGMLVEGYVSMQMKYLDEASLTRIRNVLVQHGLPLKLPRVFSEQEMMKAMALDKKSKNQQPHFVLIDKIGSAVVDGDRFCMPVEAEIIREAFMWMNKTIDVRSQESGFRIKTRCQ